MLISAGSRDQLTLKKQMSFQWSFLNEYVESNSITPEQMYNADESGLHWKMLPDKTLIVTTVFAWSWPGTNKLKSLVIGKFRSSRYFDHVTWTNYL